LAESSEEKNIFLRKIINAYICFLKQLTSYRRL